ncbi:hypothetical protein HK096_004541, partial [Nowakowskiella sp. JEL0078]
MSADETEKVYYLWNRMLDTVALKIPIRFASFFNYFDAEECQSDILRLIKGAHDLYFATVKRTSKKERIKAKYQEILSYNYRNEEWEQHFEAKVNQKRRAYEKQAIFGQISVNKLRNEQLLKADRDVQRSIANKTSLTRNTAASKSTPNILYDLETDLDSESDSEDHNPSYIGSLGKSENCQDTVIEGVNCSQLYQGVLQNMYLRSEHTIIDKNSLFWHVIQKGGLLLEKILPEEYETFISEEDYQKLYRSLAPESETLWVKVSSEYDLSLFEAQQKMEFGILEQLTAEQLQLPNFPDNVSTVLKSIYPHLSLVPPNTDKEPSYTAKFVKPHFDRLTAILGSRWNVYVDTSLEENKRPDLTIKAGSRPLVTIELRVDSASKLRKHSQPWEAFERTRMYLKHDIKNRDWGNSFPENWTCFSKDGVNYHVYKLQMRTGLCFFIQMGIISLFDSFMTLPNLTRSIMGIDRLIEILKSHESRIRKHPLATRLYTNINIQKTPDRTKLKMEADALVKRHERKTSFLDLMK